MLASRVRYIELLAMTPSRKALVVLIILAVSANISGAFVRVNPLFDRYGPITFSAEKKRLRNYGLQLKYAPDSRGVIIVYAGEPWDETAARARARRAYNYLIKNEGVPATRLQWRYEGVCKHGGVVLLYELYPKEADPMPDPTCKNS